MNVHPPDGFVPLQLRPNPYIDACGPLYGRRDGDALRLGLRVERRHCNPAGSCHGGMLTTLADMLLVLGASAQTGLSRYMLTVNLSCDFIAPAMEGFAHQNIKFWEGGAGHFQLPEILQSLIDHL